MNNTNDLDELRLALANARRLNDNLSGKLEAAETELERWRTVLPTLPNQRIVMSALREEVHEDFLQERERYEMRQSIYAVDEMIAEPHILQHILQELREKMNRAPSERADLAGWTPANRDEGLVDYLDIRFVRYFVRPIDQ